MGQYDMEDTYNFQRNMRRTSWLSYFPHWWSQNDELLNAIGDEVEYIKAKSIFELLDTAGMKPPVMLWQESLVHKNYTVNKTLTNLPDDIVIQAPLYKTWGKITITNNSEEDMDGLSITFNETNGLLINQIIAQNDKIEILEDKVLLNGKKIIPQKLGKGFPYFITSQNNEEYRENTPLHNEVIRLTINTTDYDEVECNLDVNIELENVVFTNEQNIEVTSLEAIPIDRIELYVKYDFPFNSALNGWHKAYEKKYDKLTNVLYDMITTQFYTKEFYVDVYFKTLDIPYRVAFPCYRDADIDSPYHVKPMLDRWGDELGLERRNYKRDIDERNYATTLPPYYPADIEQDYWYWKRLDNEYTWNELAINDVDIRDTEGNNVIRLYSTNPFVEDFAVRAESHYVKDELLSNYHEYIPITVSQRSSNLNIQQVPYNDIINLLTYNNKHSDVTLLAKNGININQLKYQSKELWTYFNLSDLPEDINIDNIEVIIEGSSKDSKKNKYSNENSGIVIPNIENDKTVFIPLYADKSYQMNEQVITYSNNELIDKLKEIVHQDKVIKQEAVIGEFHARAGEEARIPFTLKEDGELITDFSSIKIYFNDIVVDAQYINKKIVFTVPIRPVMTKMTIQCKSEDHWIFTDIFDIRKEQHEEEIEEEDSAGNKSTRKRHYQTINGPIVDGVIGPIELKDTWHTNDIRNALQKKGIYFCNIFENEDEYSQTTLDIKNLQLKISYTPKKSTFSMETAIDKKVTAPKIGQYQLNITNTGEKPLYTVVDIINPPNIKLDKNFVEVELREGQSLYEEIDIYPQYPIDDGYYEILTICEDKTKINTIGLFSTGLIETAVDVQEHHGKYNTPITIQARIKTLDYQYITYNNNIEVYINNHLINENIEVKDNIMRMQFTPSDYNIETGLLPLVIKYEGDEKYANSQGQNTIFIGKDSTNITINSYDIFAYKTINTISAKVEYWNESRILKPVNNGFVSFYIGDTYIGRTSNVINGIFTIETNIDVPPGSYQLWAKYSDSDTYASNEVYKDIKITGGDTHINVTDINASPADTITLKAILLDVNNQIVPNKDISFDVDTDYFEIHTTATTDSNGIAEYTVDLSEFDINISNNQEISTDIIATLEASDGYTGSTGVGTLTISKRKVLIETDTVYEGTQYEPLGFYVHIKDATTYQPITEGKVRVSVLEQPGIQGEAFVDEDGGCRIICNSMVSIDSWDTANDYSFFVGTDNQPTITRNGVTINLKEEYPELTDNLDTNDLYVIYQKDGEQQAFFINEDGILYYDGGMLEDSIDKYFYIGEDKHLYVVTSSKERVYQTGTFDVQFEYIGNKRYRDRKKILDYGLMINNSSVDLDLHNYNLSYNSKRDITCFTTKYDTDAAVNGNVEFYMDDVLFDTVNVQQSKAIISHDRFMDIEKGNHLLKCKYKKDTDLTYTYSKLYMGKITPIMTIRFSSKIKGEPSTLHVKININDDKILIDGFVNVYLDGKKIAYQYLYGNEGYLGIINEGYTTDDIGFITGYTNDVTFSMVMPDDIDINHDHIVRVEYEGNDYINSAEISENLMQEPSDVKITCYPINIPRIQKNNITLYIDTIEEEHLVNDGYINLTDGIDTISNFAVINNQSTISWTPDASSNYYIQYIGNDSYNTTKIYTLEELGITLQQPEEYIYYDGTSYHNLADAIRCLAVNGTIEIDGEYSLSSLKIEKPINIQATNNSAINLEGDLLINSIIKIDNLKITAIDNAKIINNEKLIIKHCILDKTLSIVGKEGVDISRSLVYCNINTTNPILDNNWWGSNESPYPTNNNIILTLTSSNENVITEDVHLVGKMIGGNGVEYDIPQADFALTSNTGYFSVDNGKVVNQTINSTFFDPSDEDTVSLTVDNQTVTLDIYHYNKLTEVIIEEINGLPNGQRVEISADVHSVTESYDTNKQKMHGYVTFYFDNEQIGRSILSDNHASVILYLRPNTYSIGDHKIKAVYKPFDDYFASEQEIDVQVVENGIYVSNVGNDSNDGSFTEPFKTLQHAVNEAAINDVIYILDDEWNENNIHINKGLTITSWKGTTFKDINGECIFDIDASIIATVNIENIDFIENNVDVIFKDTNNITKVSKCVFYKNNNVTNDDIEIKWSAVIEQGINTTNYVQCWFGSNNPRTSLNSNINDYVIMDVKPSKEYIYAGIIASLKATLQSYRHHEGSTVTEYPLEHPLPLRIAKFTSNYGLIDPYRDYTYNNYATAYIDLSTPSHRDLIHIDILDTIQNINKNITIKCHIYSDFYDDISGQAHIELLKNDTTIVSDDIEIENEYAILSTKALPEGEYNIICTYMYNGVSFSASSILTVKPKDIIVEELNINSANNRSLYFTATFKDNWNETINTPVDIYIDDKFIQQGNIVNNQLSMQLQYDILCQGQHTLKLSKTKGIYDTFEYSKLFSLNRLDTNINFPYTYVKPNTDIPLTISVTDNNEIFVKDGYVDILIDGEEIATKRLTNGQYTLMHTFEDNQEYSVNIIYHTLKNCYNDTAKTFLISAGIYEVTFENLTDISADMTKPVYIDVDVLDKTSQLVSKGYANIYLDNILIDEKIDIEIGKLRYNTVLPNYVQPGNHSLRIDYKDPTNTFKDTTASVTLTLNKINTNIQIGTIIGYPEQTAHIPFEITSTYGRVNTGTLTLSYVDEYNIERKHQYIITDNIANQIIFVAPNLPMGEYDCQLMYQDDSGYYNDKIVNTKIYIQKNKVNILPVNKQYYPLKELDFSADIKNQDGKRIDVGTADIYIDNVKTIEDLSVVNGQISSKIIFNQAKIYGIDILYHDNDYYAETSYHQEFTVDKIPIERIDIEYNDDRTIIEELIFVSENGIVINEEITDGIADIFIDGKQVNSYYIIENNKFIDLDISDIRAGEHTIEIKYHDSEIFDNYSTERPIPYYKEYKTLDIYLNDKIAENSQQITFNGRVSDDIEGNIKIFLDDTLVGIAEIKNRQFALDFTLPKKYTNTEYEIKGLFVGNDYYAESEDTATLFIRKQDKDITINDVSAKYNEEINIYVQTEISNPLIHFFLIQDKTITIDNEQPTPITQEEETSNRYINNIQGTSELETPIKHKLKCNVNVESIQSVSEKYIGSKVFEDGDNIFTYKLDKTMIGEYTIVAQYDGSSIYNATEGTALLTVEPYTPTIDINNIECYIGSEITLYNVAKDINNAFVNIGDMKYTIDNEPIVFDVKYSYDMDAPSVDNITVQYKTNNEYYTDSEIVTIPVVKKKNDILLDIDMPLYATYGEDFNVTVKGRSLTTNKPLTTTTMSISYGAENSYTFTKQNDEYVIKAICNIPIPDTPLDSHMITFTTPRGTTQAFNQTVVNRSIKINKSNYIIVDSTIEEVTINRTNNIGDALSLIKDNGIIEIMTPLEDETINITKNITLKGNTSLHNCVINCANKRIKIQNLTFDNCKLDNNGETSITNCRFINNQNKYNIMNNNKINITDTVFEDNNVGQESCIKLQNKNIHTVINNCVFNHNNGSLNGTCIYSNQANELTISNTQFINNKNQSVTSSCIYVYGNISFTNNIVYNNHNTYDIRLLNGEITGDNNIFENSNIIQIINGTGDMDFNYWGDIASTDDIKIEGNIVINSWLVGEIIRDGTKMTPTITEYQNNLEVGAVYEDIEYPSFYIIDE